MIVGGCCFFIDGLIQLLGKTNRSNTTTPRGGAAGWFNCLNMGSFEPRDSFVSCLSESRFEGTRSNFGASTTYVLTRYVLWVP